MNNNRRGLRRGYDRGGRIVPILIKASVWIAMIFTWWLILTIFIDMPSEYKLRHSTDNLRKEYYSMSAHYDSITNVLDNVIHRDENVFRKLFESNPYDLSADFEKERIELYEQLVEMNGEDLHRLIDEHMQTATNLEERVIKSYDDLKYNITSGMLSIDCVPAIQPINNRRKCKYFHLSNLN